MVRSAKKICEKTSKKGGSKWKQRVPKRRWKGVPRTPSGKPLKYASGRTSVHFHSQKGAKKGRLFHAMMEHEINCQSRCTCGPEFKKASLTTRNSLKKQVDRVLSWSKGMGFKSPVAEKKAGFGTLSVRMDLVFLTQDGKNSVYVDLKKGYKSLFNNTKSKYMSIQQKKDELEKHRFQIASCCLTWNRSIEANIAEGKKETRRPMTHSYLFYADGPGDVVVPVTEWEKHRKGTEELWYQE